jgi:hypothetical protein
VYRDDLAHRGGLACWQAISDIRALARQAMGAFVGCSCVRARPIPAASGGRLRHRTGPPFAITAGVPLAGAWRLGERSPAVAHCLLWVVEKGGDCKHCFAVEVHEGRLLERAADLRSLRKLGPERSIRYAL